MFCNVYKKFVVITDILATKAVKLGLKANLVSLTGFIFGLLAVNFIALSMFYWAILLIILNRFCDVLDGAIAKKTKPTDFGCFLDMVLDYTFYAITIFAFALANPQQNAVAASFLLFAFLSCATATLTFAAVSYRKNKKTANKPFYMSPLMHGTEIFAALICMCLLPNWFMQLAIGFGVLALVKSAAVVIGAFYTFNISGIDDEKML